MSNTADTLNDKAMMTHSISSLLNEDDSILHTPTTPTPSMSSSSSSSLSSSLSSPSSSPRSKKKQPSDATQTQTQKGAGGRTLSSAHYGSFAVRSTDIRQSPSGTPPKGLSKSSTSRIQLAKSFRCDQCFQTFSRLNNLKSHRTTHTSERPYQCDQCHQDFRRQHDLKRHQKLHTGERPFKCTNCHRSFARLDALNRHQRVEGGTACHNNGQYPSMAAVSKIETPPFTNHRPHIPEINIPHPATKSPISFIPSALSSENNNLLVLPWSPSSRTLPLPSSSPPQKNKTNYLLPSPSSPPSSSSPYASPPLPPSSSSFILLPSPSSSLSPATTPSSIDNHPPNFMPRSTTPSSIDFSSGTEDASFWKSEYDQIKKSMLALQERTQWQEKEIKMLKTTVHDLKVENNVLTSLVLTKKQSSPQQNM
ncbi:unnamed protein product [Absidia cylindrospora]